MSNLRTHKNIQSAVSSAVFVGLCAEHGHVSKFFANEIHSEDGLDVLETIKQLQQEVSDLKTRLDELTLKDLKDVSVDEVSDGDALVYQNKMWQPAELFKDDTNVSFTLS